MPAYYTPFLERAGATVGRALESRGLRQQQAEQNRLAGSAYMGDPRAMQDLMQLNPTLGAKILEETRKRKETTQQQALTKRTAVMKERDALSKDIARFDTYEEAKAYADPKIADILQSYPEVAPKAGVDQGLTREGFNQAKQIHAKEKEDLFAKINPLDYTSDSLRSYQETGNVADLQPRAKEADAADIAKELAVNFKNAKVLRGEFTKVTKNYADINEAYGRIKVSSKDPSPAGDLSMIFNYMKMLDPESVVRESEFATAAATGALGERMKAAYSKIVTGEKLSDKMRNDFVSRAKSLYDESTRIHEGRVKEFTKKAEQFDIDPSKVIFERQFHETIEGKGGAEDPITKMSIEELRAIAEQ